MTTWTQSTLPGAPRSDSIVRSLTRTDWNDTDNQFALPDVTYANRILTPRLRRVLRALDDWTLDVFNPRLPSDER